MRLINRIIKITAFLVFGLSLALPSLWAETKDAGFDPYSMISESAPALEWIWGEVISVEPENQQIKIKYFDYENDTDKEAVIIFSDKTEYENIEGISQIAPNDTVSVDYVISPQGKYEAKIISVEKPLNQGDIQQEPLEEEQPEQAPPEDKEEKLGISGY